MGRSDSERAPVLSAMLPSVSAWPRATAPRPRNVADLTSPRTYAVCLDGAGRGLSTRAGRQNGASRRLGGGGTWPLDVGGGSGGGGRPGPGDLGLAGGPLPLELAEPVAE